MKFTLILCSKHKETQYKYKFITGSLVSTAKRQAAAAAGADIIRQQAQGQERAHRKVKKLLQNFIKKISFQIAKEIF